MIATLLKLVCGFLTQPVAIDGKTKNGKMQVRPAGHAAYSISLVASLGAVPVKCCVPPVNPKAEVLRLFRRFRHTHTHTDTEGTEEKMLLGSMQGTSKYTPSWPTTNFQTICLRSC